MINHSPAQTLPDAFNALDPLIPISHDQIDTLFIPRPKSPIIKMKTFLEISARPSKLLFVGHRGAGKSSEMAYLSTLLADSFITIFTPLYDVYRAPSVTHTEVIFAVYLSLLKWATDEKLVHKGIVTEGWKKLMEHIYDPLRTRLFGADAFSSVGADTSITFKLNVLVTELEAKIGAESHTREQVRTKFEGRIAEILTNIKQLALMLNEELGLPILLIVEDLDKLDLESTRGLFMDHAGTLTTPYPSIIYTFPIAMRYDNNFMTIEGNFDKSYLLPNVSLKHRGGGVDEKGRATMRAVLTHRVVPELFADGVLDELITWSGGHVKTLVQLSRQSVLNCIVDGAAVVGLNHFEEAHRSIRNDYMVMLKKSQTALLKEWQGKADKNLNDTTPEVLELLFNGSLLEYANTRSWADVAPIAADLLEDNAD